jgi:hypothetical protein
MRSIIAFSSLLIFLVSCSPYTALPDSTATVIFTASSTEPNIILPTLTPKPNTSATISTTPSATPDPAEQILYSPDGKYVAKRYGPYNMPSLDNPLIEIFDEQNELLWKIPFQGKQPDGDPGVSLLIYQWANDSSKLYFKYYSYPDGGGDFAFWWDGWDLQSIDIKTGEIRRVLPGEGSMSFAISPDGSQIAYTRAQDTPGVFFIRNLALGTDTQVIVKPAQKYKYQRIGEIHWSPSGKALIFHTQGQVAKNVWPEVQVIYLNVLTQEQKVVIRYGIGNTWFENWETRRFESWADVRTLRFYGRYNEPVILFDVFTGEVTTLGTPTPSP